ncbi:hypothetical protein WJX73_009723 [Symbiochloris irregularis]|uniref:Uncharacterized protein n=1 Tax=Symbiochloris irregularis TaxID=706552 RepID=A0AAW1Q1N0_9CHLO
MPSPPPPDHQCFYGNSSTPLFCSYPPPMSPPPMSSPPPPPGQGKCYYGNSSVPLFCDYPPPPSSPSPVPQSPPPPSDHKCFYGNMPTPTLGGKTLSPIFTTGRGDYKVGATSRPADLDQAEVLIESADDFFTTNAVTIQGVSFEGLFPAEMTPQNQWQYITSVAALLYAVFPEDSTPARLLIPNDASSGTWKVASKEGSPADWPMSNITTAAYQIQKLSDDIITVPTVIEDFNIQAIPDQLQTGNFAPPAMSGKRYEIFVPFQYNLPAGAHVFVVPQIGVNCNSATPWAEDECNFVWSSAPWPVSYANQGTPFPSWIQDEQSWTRGPLITPDWASIGTQILGTQPYNAAFTVWA